MCFCAYYTSCYILSVYIYTAEERILSTTGSSPPWCTYKQKVRKTALQDTACMHPLSYEENLKLSTTSHKKMFSYACWINFFPPGFDAYCKLWQKINKGQANFQQISLDSQNPSRETRHQKYRQGRPETAQSGTWYPLQNTVTKRPAPSGLSIPNF